MGAPDYSRQREQLTKLLNHLTRRTAAIQHDLRRLDGPLSRDWEEQSIELENDEVLAGLARQGPQQIAQIRAALQRMDEGEYGVCTSCHKPIAPARLDVLPYATTCVRCAESHEAGGRS